MKKLILVAILLTGFFFVNAAETKQCLDHSVSITFGAGMRSISDDLYDDVYDKTPTTISVDLAFRIWNQLEVFAHTDMFSVDGKTTFTQEDTSLKVTPIEIGARYLISVNKDCKFKLFPYVGLGGGYYMIKEDTPPTMDNVDEKRIGFFVEGGLRFYVAGSIFIDAKVKNVFLTSEDDMKLGGFAYMGGIGFSF